MYSPSPTPKASSRGYERIASQLRVAIRQGHLLAGDKLPSVRRLAATHRVSPPTAEHALRLLESEGLVTVRPRSGFYVAQRPKKEVRSRNIARPQPVSLSGRVHEMFALARTPGFLKFGAATPHPEWLPASAMKRSMLRNFRKSGAEALLYSVPPGDPELRRQIARRSALWQGSLDPARLIVTSGATQALHIALRITTRPGDSVAVDSPCYFGTLMLLKSLGLRAIEIPLSPVGGMDLVALAATIRQHEVAAVVSVPTANNPTGLTMPVQNKKRMVQLLAQAGIPLIEDDLYGEIDIARRKEPPCKAFDEHGIVLYCSSVSKTLSPGIRIGWIEAGRHFDAALDLRVETSLGGSHLQEAALADLMASGEFDRHLRRFAMRIETSVEAISDRILSTWPAGTFILPRSSGYLLWVRLPDGVDSADLQRQAAEFGISVCPGSLFSADGTGFTQYVRMNCALPITTKLLAAIDRLGDAIRAIQASAAP